MNYVKRTSLVLFSYFGGPPVKLISGRFRRKTLDSTVSHDVQLTYRIHCHGRGSGYLVTFFFKD